MAVAVRVTVPLSGPAGTVSAVVGATLSTSTPAWLSSQVRVPATATARRS